MQVGKPVSRSGWKRAVIVLGIFITVIFGYLIYSLIREGVDLSRESLPEYNNLFSIDLQPKLQHPYTYKSKIRPPESNYIIDNSFHLTVYKLNLEKNLPLNNILKIKNTPSESGSNVASDYADDPNFKMTRTSKSVGPVSKVNFKYQGGIHLVANNDSTAVYYLKLRNFSLSNNDEADDIWGGAGPKSVAMNIAFIKREQSLYVVLLFRTGEEYLDFSSDKLYKMLRN